MIFSGFYCADIYEIISLYYRLVAYVYIKETIFDAYFVYQALRPRNILFITKIIQPFLCKLGVYNDYISKQCHCFDTYFMLFFIGFIDMLREIYRNKVMQEKYELHFSQSLKYIVRLNLSDAIM
ncbi:hypothetical protein Bwad004_19860 [Bilophila wadsworthia]